MVKRVAASILWFVATMWMFNFASAFLGVPSIVGFVVALGIGWFIGVDPLKLYWHMERPKAAPAQVVPPELVPAPQPGR